MIDLFIYFLCNETGYFGNMGGVGALGKVNSICKKVERHLNCG